MNEKKEQQPIPLAPLVRQARVCLSGAVEAIMRDFNLPPFIMDGLLCEILADVRRCEIREIQPEIKEAPDEQQHSK